MYPEFIAIYVMLGIVIAILAVVIVLLIKVLKNGASASVYPPQQQNNPYYGQQSYQAPYQAQYQPQGGNVVFCQQCATQYDASQMYCPNCGARR